MTKYDNLTAFADKDSLSWKLYEAHRAITDRYNAEREQKELEDRIVQRVLQRLTVEVKNEATPAIRELQKEISRMMKG